MSARVISSIVRQHADECGFLVASRRQLAGSPSRGLRELRAHDARIEAHLDGLRVDPEQGWRAALEALQDGDTACIFPATVLAVEGAATDRTDSVLAAALAGPDAVRGFLAACAWLPHPVVRAVIQSLLGREDLFFVHLGMAAAGLHRQDPGPKLCNVVESADPAMRARAWKVAGWIRRRDVLGSAWKAYGDESPDVRFAAGFAGPLLGDLNGITVLQALAVSEWPRRERAAEWAARALEADRARPWHEKLAADGKLGRVAVAVAGAIGEPILVPWLLSCMGDPILARAAGAAFSTITGACIVPDGLAGTKPEGLETGPTDVPEDDNVAIDPDEFLPWPDAEAVRSWWSSNGSRFRAGVRHLLGRPISPEAVHEALVHGTQRQRAAAAFEGAMLAAQQPVFETRAPAGRQMQSLGIVENV